MKKRLAIAFASVLLIMTVSFAPIGQSAVPGSDLYVTMGGKFDGRLWMYVGQAGPNSRLGVALPMAAPFATRLPLLKPNHLIQEIFFAPPVDVNADNIADIIPIQKIQINPIVHYQWIPVMGTWYRFIITALAPGSGVIFINPALPGDVDCFTFNNDSGVFWDAPSQLAGSMAAFSGGYYDNFTTFDFVPPMGARFPHTVFPDADGIPGTRLWGDIFDGFGDGVPDPVGSSILMLPVVLVGDAWNGVDWEPSIVVPMPLVMTTGVAYDHVVQWGATQDDQSLLYCTNSTEVGMPWEFISTLWDWTHPKAFAKVVYVCAWSNLRYCLNPDQDGDGIPEPKPDEPFQGFWFTVDLFYEYVEYKVRMDVNINDISGDQKVDIVDITIAGLAFGAEDEGLGRDGIPFTADDKPVADPNFDPRADLTCDGLVNIVDLVKIAVDFGKIIDP